MNQFRIFLEKEWRENLRNYKLFWIPIVFILFGIMEPATNYFLPQILDSVGNLPEGAVFEMPVPEPEQILSAVVGQYQFIGLLVLVLAYMGSIAGERKSGTATLLYVRPISFSAYFLSKWTMASAVALLSVWLGLLAGYYYTWLLFEGVDFLKFLQFAGTYSIWILLVTAIIISASAAMPNTGLAAGAALFLVFFLQIVDGLLGAYWTVSPLKLSAYATDWLAAGPDRSDFWLSVVVTVLVIAGLNLFGIWMARRNRAKTKV